MLHALLATCESHNKVSYASYRVAGKRLGAYKIASVSLPLRLEWHWSPSFGKLLRVIYRYVNDATDVHRTGIVELVSSASEALDQVSCAFFEVFRPPECGGTSSGANPDLWPGSLDVWSLSCISFKNLTSSANTPLRLLPSVHIPLFWAGTFRGLLYRLYSFGWLLPSLSLSSPSLVYKMLRDVSNWVHYIIFWP